MGHLIKVYYLLIFGASIITSQELAKQNSKDVNKSVLISKLKDLLRCGCSRQVEESLRCGCNKKSSPCTVSLEDETDDFQDLTRADETLRCGCGRNNNLEDSLRCGCKKEKRPYSVNLEDRAAVFQDKTRVDETLRCGCGRNNNLEDSLRCGCGRNNNLEDSLRCGCGRNNNLEDSLRCGCGRNNNLEDSLRCGCGRNNNLEDSLRCGCGNKRDDALRLRVEEFLTGRLRKRLGGLEISKLKSLLKILMGTAEKVHNDKVFENRIDNNKKSDESSSAAQSMIKTLLQKQLLNNKLRLIQEKPKQHNLDKTLPVGNILNNNLKRLLQLGQKFKVNDDLNAYILNTPKINSRERNYDQSLLDSFGAPSEIRSKKRKRSILSQNNDLESEIHSQGKSSHDHDLLEFIEREYFKDHKRDAKDNDLIQQLIKELHTQNRLSKDVSVEILDLAKLKRNTKKQNLYSSPSDTNNLVQKLKDDSVNIEPVLVEFLDFNKRDQSNTQVNRLNSLVEMILDTKSYNERLNNIIKEIIPKQEQIQNEHLTLNDFITKIISPNDLSDLTDNSENDNSNRDENLNAIQKLIMDVNDGQHSYETISLDNLFNTGQGSINTGFSEHKTGEIRHAHEAQDIKNVIDNIQNAKSPLNDLSKIGHLYMKKSNDLKSLDPMSKQTYSHSVNPYLNDVFKHITEIVRSRPNSNKYKPTITEQFKKNNLQNRIKIKVGRSEDMNPEIRRSENQDTQYGVPFEMNLQLLGQVLD